MAWAGTPQDNWISINIRKATIEWLRAIPAFFMLQSSKLSCHNYTSGLFVSGLPAG